MLDGAAQLGTLVSFFPMLKMMLPNLPIDADSLPSATSIKEAFPPLYGYTQAAQGGWHHHLESPVGLSLLLSLSSVLGKGSGSIKEWIEALPF